MYKFISAESRFAIYLLLIAARQRANAVRISNSFFRKKWRVSRVHKKRLCDFAEALKPFFPNYRILEEVTVSPYSFGKVTLCLYINKEYESSGEIELLEVDESLPSQEEIDEELGFKVIQ